MHHEKVVMTKLTMETSKNLFSSKCPETYQSECSKKVASNELRFQYDIDMNIRIRNLMYEILINCSDDKKITIEIAE